MADRKPPPAIRHGDIGIGPTRRNTTGANFSSTATGDRSVADKNSRASAAKRGKLTADRMKRTRQSQDRQMRKQAANATARKASRNAAARMVAGRAVPAVGAAMMAADAVGAVRRKTRAATPPKRPAMQRAGREQYRGKKR